MCPPGYYQSANGPKADTKYIEFMQYIYIYIYIYIIPLYNYKYL